MSIVTISRGSYSRGKEVAEALAKLQKNDYARRKWSKQLYGIDTPTTASMIWYSASTV